ncbi:MAG TPA: hypothetical protein VFA77_14735 [Candidatus Eisenbacteria bacterium]|jgi:hypothetical protein|nr:hypothetical protein [Candidatus Eisenbacteria bacterium]
MSDDQLFRLILLAAFVILVPIGICHRLKARTGEKLDRLQEGLFYTSAALAVLANTLAAANCFFLVAGCLMFLLLTIRTRKEEENLIARFGATIGNTWNEPAGSCHVCKLSA